MSEEIARITGQMPEIVQDTGKEDPMLQSPIELSTYDDLTEEQVLKAVKSIFRGYQYDPDDKDSSNFKDLDSLADFFRKSADEIKVAKHKVDSFALQQKAASLARFWCLTRQINTALEHGKYGTEACRKFAMLLGVSPSYIYQIRYVSQNLTIVDCYLLGMRDCTSTNLRKLAAIKDTTERKCIIRAFIDAYTSTEDPEQCERIRKQFLSALKQGKSADMIDITTSDTCVEGVSEIQVTEEYTNASNALTQIGKSLKQLTDANAVDKACNALADFCIQDTVPNSEEHLADLKEQADSILDKITTTAANLERIKLELRALKNMYVIKQDE